MKTLITTIICNWAEAHRGVVVSDDDNIFVRVSLESLTGFREFLQESFRYKYFETIPCELQGSYIVFSNKDLENNLECI